MQSSSAAHCESNRQTPTNEITSSCRNNNNNNNKYNNTTSGSSSNNSHHHHHHHQWWNKIRGLGTGGGKQLNLLHRKSSSNSSSSGNGCRFKFITSLHVVNPMNQTSKKVSPTIYCLHKWTTQQQINLSTEERDFILPEIYRDYSTDDLLRLINSFKSIEYRRELLVAADLARHKSRSLLFDLEEFARENGQCLDGKLPWWFIFDNHHHQLSAPSLHYSTKSAVLPDVFCHLSIDNVSSPPPPPPPLPPPDVASICTNNSKLPSHPPSPQLILYSTKRTSTLWQQQSSHHHHHHHSSLKDILNNNLSWFHRHANFGAQAFVRFLWGFYCVEDCSSFGPEGTNGHVNVTEILQSLYPSPYGPSNTCDCLLVFINGGTTTLKKSSTTKLAMNNNNSNNSNSTTSTWECGEPTLYPCHSIILASRSSYLCRQLKRRCYSHVYSSSSPPPPLDGEVSLKNNNLEGGKEDNGNGVEGGGGGGERKRGFQYNLPFQLVFDEEIWPRRLAGAVLHCIYTDRLAYLPPCASACGFDSVNSFGKQICIECCHAITSLFFIGQFLEFPQLCQCCEDSLVNALHGGVGSSSSVSVSVLCAILQWSSQPHGSAFVYRQVLQYLRDNFMSLISSNGDLLLQHLTRQQLIYCIQSDRLCAVECEVLSAVVRWAELEAEKWMNLRGCQSCAPPGSHSVFQSVSDNGNSNIITNTISTGCTCVIVTDDTNTPTTPTNATVADGDNSSSSSDQLPPPQCIRDRFIRRVLLMGNDLVKGGGNGGGTINSSGGPPGLGGSNGNLLIYIRWQHLLPCAAPLVNTLLLRNIILWKEDLTLSCDHALTDPPNAFLQRLVHLQNKHARRHAKAIASAAARSSTQKHFFPWLPKSKPSASSTSSLLSSFVGPHGVKSTTSSSSSHSHHHHHQPLQSLLEKKFLPDNDKNDKKNSRQIIGWRSKIRCLTCACQPPRFHPPLYDAIKRLYQRRMQHQHQQQQRPPAAISHLQKDLTQFNLSDAVECFDVPLSWRTPGWYLPLTTASLTLCPSIHDDGDDDDTHNLWNVVRNHANVLQSSTLVQSALRHAGRNKAEERSIQRAIYLQCARQLGLPDCVVKRFLCHRTTGTIFTNNCSTTCRQINSPITNSEDLLPDQLPSSSLSRPSSTSLLMGRTLSSNDVALLKSSCPNDDVDIDDDDDAYDDLTTFCV